MSTPGATVVGSSGAALVGSSGAARVFNAAGTCTDCCGSSGDPTCAGITEAEADAIGNLTLNFTATATSCICPTEIVTLVHTGGWGWSDAIHNEIGTTACPHGYHLGCDGLTNTWVLTGTGCYAGLSATRAAGDPRGAYTITAFGFACAATALVVS